MNTAIKKHLIGIAFTCGMLMSTALAQAATVTINFDTYLSGQNVGTGSIATLEADQIGADVQLKLTNTFASQPASFDTQLFLAYLGSSFGTGLSDVSGVVTSDFTNPAPATFVNAGYTWDMLVEWETSNKDDTLRLNPGESSTFLLTNALLTSLFGGSSLSPFAMLHLQGLTPVLIDGELVGSTKYGGTVVCTGLCSPPVGEVPLPAGILLLLSALGGLGFLTRCRNANVAT
jgi:hypothetical protein